MIVGKTRRQIHFSTQKFGKFKGGGKFVGKKLNGFKAAKNSI